MSDFSGTGLFCFRGGRMVFTNLGFALGSGGALVLHGPNGSGKSSLLRLMAGLLKARQGVIAWEGHDITEDPQDHNRRLHYVGHSDAVKPVLSVRQNIAFWSELRGDTGRVEAAMDVFGVGFLGDVTGRFLSAGQKRRVNLARLVATPAPLWLLDEPATALDADGVSALQAAIRTHRQTGGMVVAATHADIGLDDAEILNLEDFHAIFADTDAAP